MTKEMIDMYRQIASELSDRADKSTNENEREVLNHLSTLASYEAEYNIEYDSESSEW